VLLALSAACLRVTIDLVTEFESSLGPRSAGDPGGIGGQA
jgi:hypothetical protein